MIDLSLYEGLGTGDGSVPIVGLRILMQMSPSGEQVFAFRFDGDIHTDVVTVIGMLDAIKHELQHRGDDE